MVFEIRDDPVHAECACHDSQARFTSGDKEYVGQFDGSIAVRVDPRRGDEPDARAVPLHVVGYTTTSLVEGLGRVTLDFDFSRDVEPSELRGGGDGDDFFPAVQTMRLNILMRAEALGDRVLRSRNQGVLVNEDARAFPPVEGATYVLQEPVELVDRDRGGETEMTLTNVNTSIVSTALPANEIRVDSTLTLRPAHDGDWLSRDSERAGVTFELAEPGRVAVVLEDAGRREIRTLPETDREAGEHRVDLDLAGLEAAPYYYRLVVDGVPRTARMALVSR